MKRRERLYRGDRPRPSIQGRSVILIDDGLATGSTMRAAATALRNMQPSKIIVAVPVAAAETCADLRSEVDEVICGATPEPLWLLARGIRILSRPATRRFASCWTESPLTRRTLHSIRDQNHGRRVPPSYDVIGALTYASDGRSLFRNKLSCRGRSVPLEILQPRSQRRDFVRQRYKNEARRTAYSGDGCDRPSEFLRFIIYLLMASQFAHRGCECAA